MNLTEAQKRDLDKCYESYRHTVGSYDWPKGISIRLRTGKTLCKLGLVENCRSNVNRYSHYRMTKKGLEYYDLY